MNKTQPDPQSSRSQKRVERKHQQYIKTNYPLEWQLCTSLNTHASISHRIEPLDRFSVDEFGDITGTFKGRPVRFSLAMIVG